MLFVAVVLMAFTVNAQDVNFGLKAGANFATITGDDTDDLSTRTSFHVGALAEIGISDTFSIQPEVLYSSQGAEYEDSDGYDGKFKLDYLNIPVLAKVTVAEGLSVEAGPQIGFLLSAKDEYDDGAGDSGEEDIDEFIKGTDFGAAVGLTYGLANGINFGARYTFGISDINDVSESTSEIRNGVFMISVGYLFGGGGGE